MNRMLDIQEISAKRKWTNSGNFYTKTASCIISKQGGWGIGSPSLGVGQPFRVQLVSDLDKKRQMYQNLPS